MDHAPAEIASTAKAPAGSSRPACAECMAPFRSPQPGQLFCCPAHRIAFQDRWRVRGRQLAPLATADRITRGGTARDKEIGKKARLSCQRLMARWIAEDRDAGRMAMDDYVRRWAKHHDLPL